MSTSSTTRAQTAERGKKGRGAGPDRVPVPTRQRRPGLAALAIVLILGGAALSGYLVLTSGEKTAVVVATGEIKAGQPIERAMLGEAQVAADSDTDTNLVDFSQVNELVDQLAKGTIPAGTLINGDMVEAPEKSSCIEVTFAVQQGNFTPVSPGEVVKLYFHAKDDSGASTVPETLATAIYVTNVQAVTTTAGSGARVTVLAKAGPSNLAGTDGAITEANQTGTISLARLLNANPAEVKDACGPAGSEAN